MSHRINLFNYHQQQIKFLKIRVYLLFGFSVILAILLNLVLYLSLQVSILEQQEINNFWVNQLHVLDKQVQPINDFKQRVERIQDKIKLIKVINNKRDDSIAVMHVINNDTPRKVYFTSISGSFITNTLFMKGVAASPLYLSELLDYMRESGSPFIDVKLKSNNTSDQNLYNFEISAMFDKNLLKVEFESNGR